MRIVSCPSSLGSAVESESSSCLEVDMFEVDMSMSEKKLQYGRCDFSLTCHHKLLYCSVRNAMALI
jgi:hypothetical protein